MAKTSDETEKLSLSQGQPAAQKQPEQKADAADTMITYVPQPGDPSETVWNGHKFVANMPKAVKAVHKDMIEQAKSNPWFHVKGFDKAEQADHSTPKLPKDSDGYRRWAVAWFKTVKSADEMKERWASEEELRQACGVGGDDLDYLDKLYVPRLAELEKAKD